MPTDAIIAEFSSSEKDVLLILLTSQLRPCAAHLLRLSESLSILYHEDSDKLPCENQDCWLSLKLLEPGLVGK